MTEQFDLSGFTASGQAQIWEYGVAEDDAQANSATNLASLTNFNTALSISGDSFSYAVPDYTMMVISLTPQTGPTVTQAAAADPNPVTGTTTNLTAAGSENGSGAGLNYTWSATSVPAGVAAPTYSVNGTNAAASTIATFFGAGNYSFLVTITDASNNSTTSSVNVTVQQTPTGVMVTPNSATVAVDGTQQFSASATDQFGNAINSPTFNWSIAGVSDGNSIDDTGLATLGSTLGTYTVTAALGSASNTAQVTVAATPTVSSFQVNDGNPQRSMIDSLTVTFNEPVTLAGNAITLNMLSQTGGSPTPMTFTLNTPDGGTTWVLTFTDPSFIGGSLPDGAYQLSVAANDVTGPGNLSMSANQSFEFIRLYGDFNGDGVVNSIDFGTFASAFGHSTNSSDWYLDYDGNGVINSIDFGYFATNFGRSMSIPSMPSVTLLTAAAPPPAPPPALTPTVTLAAVDPTLPSTPTPTPTITSTSKTKASLTTSETTLPALRSMKRSRFDIGTNRETSVIEGIDGPDDRQRCGDAGVWPTAGVGRRPIGFESNTGRNGPDSKAHQMKEIVDDVQ